MFWACQPKEGASGESLRLHIQLGKQILPEYTVKNPKCRRPREHGEPLLPSRTHGMCEMLTAQAVACSDQHSLRHPPPAALWVSSQMLKLPDLCYASHIDLGERQIIRSHENVHYIANQGQSFEESCVRKNYPLSRVCERAHTCVHSGVVK